MLSGITITCFAASYGVSFVAEVSRLFFRAPIRMVVIILFAAAGLFAHTLFLLTRAGVTGDNIAPLSNWFDWCLIGSWILAAVYLSLAVKRLENALGVFLLPVILALIGLAVLLRDQPPFPRDAALGYWRSVHGGALLLGTVAVTLGFVAGLMYLAQSYRLKHKLPPRPGFRLPSLEWLQRCNKAALVVSTGLLGIGLLSGIVMNAGRAGGAVAWSDPVVLSSGVLFAWLITATSFEAFYKPARQGRKVAYLTLASFIFLALVLVFVLSGRHASSKGSGGSVSMVRQAPHPRPSPRGGERGVELASSSRGGERGVELVSSSRGGERGVELASSSRGAWFVSVFPSVDLVRVAGVRGRR